MQPTQKAVRLISDVNNTKHTVLISKGGNMAKVESKSIMDINIKVVGKDGKKKGQFIMTSGNIYYYKKNAKIVTAKYTYQQLIDLIESDIEE
jgi:hypothetical protein